MFATDLEAIWIATSLALCDFKPLADCLERKGGSVPTPVHVGTPANGVFLFTRNLVVFTVYSEFINLCVTWSDRCCLVCVSTESMYRRIVSKPARDSNNIM